MISNILKVIKTPSVFRSFSILTITSLAPNRSFSTTTTASLAPKLSAYTYPYGDPPQSKPAADLLFIKNIPVIPHEIFIKVIDIDKTQKVLTKPYVDSDFLKEFKRSPQPTFTLMINGPEIAMNLNKVSAQMVIDAIKIVPSDIFSQFKAVTLDIEPVYDYVLEIDNVALVSDIITRINKDLTRPVSVYISPAKLANDKNGMVKNAPGNFKRLMSAIKSNPNNCILLPDYVQDKVYPADVKDSVDAIRTAGGSKNYKLIVNTRDYGKGLDDRLQTIKTNNYAENGLCIFSVEVGQETNYPATLGRIKAIIPDLLK